MTDMFVKGVNTRQVGEIMKSLTDSLHAFSVYIVEGVAHAAEWVRVLEEPSFVRQI